ncbi:MAG: hypothetical protein HZA77_12255 [Candidatus Schekmanbacteria bacterium]|nr:hypothetical protein [Candidatus Schekmanbacteria bacterium]
MDLKAAEKFRGFFFMASLFCAFFVIPATVHADEENSKCFVCHGKVGFANPLKTGKVISLYINFKEFSETVHGKKLCTDCHTDVKQIPHRNVIGKVNCANQCHFLGNPSGAPETVKYIEYKNSIHGKALFAGNQSAPQCQDCHGKHNIFKPSDLRSADARENIPKTCGKCHLQEYVDFNTSIHGTQFKAGNKDVPVCTSCHGEHNIFKPEDARSTVSAAHITKTCSACHDKVQIMEKYGIPTEQVATYDESFHGIAVEFGVKKAANCSSCHGYHDIRASEDPGSSININNIPKTCGKCHPGANVNFAKGKVHINPKSKESGIVYYISKAFMVLTISTMLVLIIHIMLDLRKRMQKRKENRE